jgi:hypothetical protein
VRSLDRGRRGDSVVSARRHGGKQASPDAGIDSESPAKDAGEVRLIGHSAVESDPRKRLPRVQHDDLGAAHAPSDYIGVGTLTDAPTERAREVADAEVHDAGEVRNPDVRINIDLDVGGRAFHLPGREAAPQNGRLIPSVSLSVAADLQQLCRPLYANSGPIVVAVESDGCRGKELDERFVTAA